MRSLHLVVRDVRDLLLPRECVGCGGGELWLCRSCLDSLNRTPESRWLGGAGERIRLTYAAPYEGVAAAAVLAYKERGLRSIADVLAALAVRAARGSGGEFGCDPPCVVPVPATWQARLRRGGDTWLRVCRQAFPCAGVGDVSPALRWAGWVQPQKTLDKDARGRNVRGQLTVKPGWTGPGRVIVADDVVTTGATVLEAARALRLAGWDVEGAAAICG
ncbi:MAG: hypothetical protein U0990_07660 [Candidatus Nanopelagicales bacterium]|nr:hypothetical protein [Candidatus Nanopelagicales bacterium]MDZ4249950.1 hypothetical protein [Candidatus Nanopelagicales bacterium]